MEGFLCFILYSVTVPGTLLDGVVCHPLSEILIIGTYPKLVCQIMIVMLDIFYLPTILPSHIHMDVFYFIS